MFIRGKTVLKQAKESIKLLTDKNGNFRVPTLFLTNAGNELCSSKSAKLSSILGVNINPDQVVLSHSPLKLAAEFHKKHCLISGQGPIVEIATKLGFKKVITIDELRQYYPQLDVVDHKRRNFAPCVLKRYLPQIEAVVLFGESVRWETSLQIIADVLMCNGKLDETPREFPRENLPILACNTDLVWMAEASMPRFGHGTFLHCLEQVYSKLSGYDLKYSYLVGKPYDITYIYAENLINRFAKSMGINEKIKRLYAVGDNLDTDIAGANIYNKLLEKNKKITNTEQEKIVDTKLKSLHKNAQAESVHSILVRTGVYQGDENEFKNSSLVYAHKDANIDNKMREPKSICDNVYDAVKLVYKLENFN